MCYCYLQASATENILKHLQFGQKVNIHLLMFGFTYGHCRQLRYGASFDSIQMFSRAAWLVKCRWEMGDALQFPQVVVNFSSTL